MTRQEVSQSPDIRQRHQCLELRLTGPANEANIYKRPSQLVRIEKVIEPELLRPPDTATLKPF